MTATISVNKELLTGTVPVNKKLLAGTVPVNKELLTGTVPVNNLFLDFLGFRVMSVSGLCLCHMSSYTFICLHISSYAFDMP